MPNTCAVVGRQGLAREALALLEGALALWPATPVKLHYIEKLIQQNQAQSLDPPPALVIGARLPLHLTSGCLLVPCAGHLNGSTLSQQRGSVI